MAFNFFIFVCLVGIAFGAQSGPYNINKKVDAIIEEHNKEAAATGRTTKKVFDFEGHGVVGRDVTISDYSTITRSGDALLWVDGEDYKVQVRIGFSTWVLDVKNFTFSEGPTRHVWFNADDYSRMMEFTLKMDGSTCKMQWDNYVWERAGHVTMHSDDPKYEGLDVSEDFEKISIPIANQKYKSETFQKYLRDNYDFCKYASY